MKWICLIVKRKRGRQLTEPFFPGGMAIEDKVIIAPHANTVKSCRRLQGSGALAADEQKTMVMPLSRTTRICRRDDVGRLFSENRIR